MQPSEATSSSGGTDHISASDPLPGGWTMTTDDRGPVIASLQQPGSGFYQDDKKSQASFPPLSLRKRPSPLNLEKKTELPVNVPISVSNASHLSSAYPGSHRSKPATRRVLDKDLWSTSASSEQSRLPLHEDLYRKAETIFDPAYSMKARSQVTLRETSVPPDGNLARISRFSDDTLSLDEQSLEQQPDSNKDEADETVRLYARSHDSKSSADSSSTLPEPDEFLPHSNNSRHTSGLVQSHGVRSKDDEPLSPLRNALTLASPALYESPTSKVLRRPVTSEAAMSPMTPLTGARRFRHAHTSSDQELLRRVKSNTSGDKMALLHASFTSPRSPNSPTKPLPSPARKSSFFGLRMRAVSTPRLRQSRDSAANEAAITSSLHTREASANSKMYPPQAPSGRFQSRTLGGSDESLSSSRVVSTAASIDSQSKSGLQGAVFPRLRRPSSSTEAFTAAARRLRRPSRGEVRASSSQGSSTTSLGQLENVQPTTRSRVTSSTSSQLNTDVHTSRGGFPLATRTGLSRKHKVSTPTGRPKTKGGWASYLSEGLTLHIEQGSKKTQCRMNYLYYDPFGKPENLCTDMAAHGRVGLGSSQGSNNPFGADSTSEAFPDSDQTGVLEFEPESSQTLGGQFAFVTSDVPEEETASSVVLRHLTIGEDKNDLITRQANLSLLSTGTHEVSGSERKGKVAWRFVFAVEDLHRANDSNEDHQEEFGSSLESFKNAVQGVRLLRPVRFSCSTTLLDPSRARKSRVINMIRKQIGPHIESLPVSRPGTGGDRVPSPRIDITMSPTSPHRRGNLEHLSPSTSQLNMEDARSDYAPGASSSLNSKESATLAVAEGADYVSRRKASFACNSDHQVSPTWSPQNRPGLVPFKMRKPLVDALRAPGLKSEEVDGLSSLEPSPRVLSTSPVQSEPPNLRSGSALASPLSSHYDVPSLNAPVTPHIGHPSPAKSARELGRSPGVVNGRYLNYPIQKINYDDLYRQRGFSVDHYRNFQRDQSALGLETNALPSHNHDTKSKAPSASEEIKLAYLSNAQEKKPVITSNGTGNQHDNFHMGQGIHSKGAQRPVLPQRTTSSSTPPKTLPASPSSKKKAMVATVLQGVGLHSPRSSSSKDKEERSNRVSTKTFAPPEGPFWL